jgi:hypothetical protein
MVIILIQKNLAAKYITVALVVSERDAIAPIAPFSIPNWFSAATTTRFQFVLVIHDRQQHQRFLHETSKFGLTTAAGATTATTLLATAKVIIGRALAA